MYEHCKPYCGVKMSAVQPVPSRGCKEAAARPLTASHGGQAASELGGWRAGRGCPPFTEPQRRQRHFLLAWEDAGGQVPVTRTTLCAAAAGGEPGGVAAQLGRPALGTGLRCAPAASRVAAPGPGGRRLRPGPVGARMAVWRRSPARRGSTAGAELVATVPPGPGGDGRA